MQSTSKVRRNAFRQVGECFLVLRQDPEPGPFPPLKSKSARPSLLQNGLSFRVRHTCWGSYTSDAANHSFALKPELRRKALYDRRFKGPGVAGQFTAADGQS